MNLFRSFFRFFILLAALVTVSIGSAQTTIWYEDFLNEANDAVAGNDDNLPVGADWTTSCSTCNKPSEFRVESNEFKVENTDEIATWTSETITITGYTNVGAIVKIDMDDGDFDATDCITIFYKLNGGTKTQFPTNGNLCDDGADPVYASVTGLSGNTLQIIFEAITSNTDEDLYIDEVTVTGSKNMAFTSVTTTQNNPTHVLPNTTDQEIIGIEVITDGDLNPFNVTQLILRTDGSTGWSNDITGNLDIYYTGTSSVFATTTLFGSASPLAPGNDITFNGTQTLSGGTNYFWVTYDIASGATLGNVLDAICNQITLSGGVGNKTPTITDPSRNRKIYSQTNPSGITAKIWFKADNYVSGSANWYNDAGNANIPSLNTSTIFLPVKNSSNVNYNPSVTFAEGGNGQDDFAISGIDYSDVLGANQGSFVIVMADNNLSDYNHTFGYFTIDPVREEFSIQSDGAWRRAPSGNWAAFTTTTSAIFGIFNASFTNSDPDYNYLNGKVNGSGTYDDLSYTTTSLGTLVLGAVGIPDQRVYRDFGGDITEVLSFSTALTATERNKVDSYLAVKYGITLDNSAGGTAGDYTSPDGTNIWDASVGSGYHNDVIGIGREDDESLNQKQSHTLDDSIRIFISTLAASNASNAGTISNDESYVIIGHNNDNNVATVVPSIEKPNGIYSRIDREWKITNTDFSDDYSIELKLRVPNTEITLSHLRLLVDDNGDFSNATIYNTPDVTFEFGSIIISGIGTNEIPLNSTRYITLASISGSTPLPVDFYTFNAFPDQLNRTIRLNWETITEINNEYFTIERSDNGLNWEKVTTVDGAGNSTELLKYNSIDYNPYYGKSFYRLKQIDFDGKTNYSKVKIVEHEDINSQVKIYPNPTVNSITIEGNKTELRDIRIYNSMGQNVTSFVYQSSEDLSRITVDMSNLPQGIYIVKTRNTVNKVYKR